MYFKTLSSAACILLLSATSSIAMTMDFNFSFTNVAFDSGTVTGIVRGLSEGASSPASVEIFTNTSGFGIGKYADNLGGNSFTVSSGMVTAAYFVSYGAFNSAGANDGSLGFTINHQQTSATLSPDRSGLNYGAPSDISFTLITVSEVPLPPTIALFLTGLAGLAGVSRWKKRAA